MAETTGGVSRGEIIASVIIIFLAIIFMLLYWLYIYVASIRDIFPFITYVVVQPNNSTIYGLNPQPLTTEQVTQRQQTAFNVCEYVANSENFMTIYCGKSPTNTVDCSKISNWAPSS